MNESDLERRVADVLRKRSEDAMRAVHVEEDLDTLRRRAKREARSRRTLGVAAVLVMLVAGAGAAVLLPERGSSAPDSAAAAPPSASADATPASNAPTDPHGVLDLLGLSTDELRRYEDFRSVSVWSGETRNGTSCLLVARLDQGFREGLSADDCSPDGSDAVADWYRGIPGPAGPTRTIRSSPTYRSAV